MIGNKALIDYLVEFHATRNYFECHEIMEEYWKSNDKDEYAQLYIAFIQVAVGQYHDRRGNRNGAKGMYEKALHKFTPYQAIIKEIDLNNLCDQIQKRLNTLNNDYFDFNFVINDEALKQACFSEANARHLIWGLSSELVSSEIINRHKTRDRSSVIANRQASLQIKQSLRQKTDHMN